jgi:hypothetical protein
MLLNSCIEGRSCGHTWVEEFAVFLCLELKMVMVMCFETEPFKFDLESKMHTHSLTVVLAFNFQVDFRNIRAYSRSI